MNYTIVPTEQQLAEEYCALAQQINNIFKRPTIWTLVLTMPTHQQVVKSDMLQLANLLNTPPKLTQEQQFIQNIVKATVNRIKCRFLDHVMPNNTHDTPK